MAARRRPYGYEDIDRETGEVRPPAQPTPRTTPIAEPRVPPAEIPALTEKSDRIAWIVDLMRELTWPVWPESLKFRKRLSDLWGVSDSAIRGYAAEAHRVVELDPQDRLEIAKEVARRCDDIYADAVKHVNEQTGLPDLAVALKALEMKAKFLGAEPPKEVKHSGTVSLTAIDEMRKALEEG